ncbi:hypothetical protein SAMN05216480_10462 [Pustulibacterium marinum]|uniref:DUF6438 domain-containing protein n=1 Tax=Pustulibacterium marinum TaxID=1224947 RepID=A0A1I7GBC4_9FLAO|nr:DUF6438 domain-containing protein [Pustulibacterium marinum]SFU45735.1 hypothetical protein SAMN05216480_10462 [Pustulibacterium marinum]
MKKVLGICCLLVTIVSCSSKKASQDALQGNWQTAIKKSDAMDMNNYIMSFQDTACLYMSPYAYYSKYSVANDTLAIIEPSYNKGNATDWEQTSNYMFKIVNLDDTVLELQPISEEAKGLLLFTGNKNASTVTFEKIPVIDNTRPFQGLAFYSTVCFGACPAMYVELKADGSFTFFGERYTQKEGWYTGKLSKEAMQTVLTLVQSIPLESLEANYKANYTDAASRAVLINSGGKEYQTTVYGSSKEPVALRILLGTLLKMYERTELKKDPNAANTLSYPEFYKR